MSFTTITASMYLKYLLFDNTVTGVAIILSVISDTVYVGHILRVLRILLFVFHVV